MEEIEVLDDKPKKKRKKKTKKIYIIIILILLIAIAGCGFWGYMRYQAKLLQDEETRINNLIADIKSHYSESVIVTKDTDLIESGSVIGTVYKNSIIELNDINIDENTKYFSIKDLNYDISYKDVSINDETPSILSKLAKENRYKNYIIFNKNLVTKDSYSLYYNGVKTYTFNNSDTYPIIINNYEDYYYVEYNNKLYGINKDDVKEIVNANNSTKKNKEYITTLCYHRITDNTERYEKSIYRKVAKFDADMKYIKDNGYLTLTMEEMVMYLQGNIMIEKGVTVTLDDGWYIDDAETIFKKYGLNGTAFVITSNDWNYSVYDQEYVQLHSHTHAMHTTWVCPSGLSKIGSATQGGGILCKGEEFIMNDLKTSRDFLNGSIALAFPFYDYNDSAINFVKKAGFKISFIGANGVRGKAYPNKTNLYMVPRMTVWDTNTLNDVISYL